MAQDMLCLVISFMNTEKNVSSAYFHEVSYEF